MMRLLLPALSLLLLVACEGDEGVGFSASISFPESGGLGRASYIFTAIDDHELAGRQVAAGDFNGDGMMDLAVGAPDAGGTVDKRGQTYLMFAR
jgi:hypothetical protein